MRVLSLDQAPNNVGWAYGSDEPGAKFTYGCDELPDFGERYQLFKRAIKPWFNKLLDKSKPDRVTVEQIVKTPNWRVQYRQFALVSAVEDFCENRNLDLYDVEIGLWRARACIPTQRPKWARGDSKWLKELAMQRCAERGWLPETEHEAEATLMLDWSLAHWCREYRHRTGPLLRRIETTFDNAQRAFGK